MKYVYIVAAIICVVGALATAFRLLYNRKRIAQTKLGDEGY